MTTRTCTNDVSIAASIEAHLGLRNLGYHTHYLVALEEARHLSGRDIKTGKYNPSHEYVGFLGLLGYLCIIEHLGGIFSPKVPVRTTSSTNRFKGFLFEFTSHTDDTIRALYGLRCSLAHNFSLTNSDSRHLYCYTLVRSVTEPLLTSAKKAWDGVFRDSSGSPYDYHTRINMVKVGDIVEGIHQQLIDLHRKKELDCIVDQPQLELISRYTFILNSKP